MWGLVCIAILGMCFFIDITSGDRGRAGGAWILLTIIVTYCVVICVKDTVDKHNARVEKERLMQEGMRQYKEAKERERNSYIPEKIIILKRRFPGRSDQWYDDKAHQYSYLEVYNVQIDD